MNKKLFLFTSDYPFGSAETFLETEIDYLSKGFDKVVIISQNSNSKQIRAVPANCEVRRINLSVSFIQKLISILGVFNPVFWRELKIIKTIYKQKLTTGILSTMLISLYRAKNVKKEVVEIVQENKADAQLFFYSYWCDDAALGIALFREKNPRIKAICRLHGWDVYFEVSSQNYLPYRHFIAENLSAIYAISQKGQEYTKQKWKVPVPEKVKIARLGVSEQSSVQPKEHEFIVVSCSNVIPLKRVDLIVKALSELNNINLTWVHFGDGPQLEEVKRLAQQILPQTISVQFKGRVSNREVLKWYADNHPSLFINVSTSEGIPVSIMEAMSFGIPVIATNVGGSKEIVNAKNGVLLPANPTGMEIVETLMLLIENNKLLREKSESALNMWKVNYNAEKNYASFVNEVLEM